MIEDSLGARPLDVTIPGGAYETVAKVGWKAARSGTSWTYVDKSTPPPGGVTKLAVRDLSKKQAGLLTVKVAGKRGGYPVDLGALSLTGLVVLDPPTAATGQCGIATFVGPTQSCTTDGKTVKCR